jgi:hypothetical protein
MSEPLIAIPLGGWTTDDLDDLPVSNYRYELTDGALSVAPPPSNLHRALSVRLFAALEDVTPEPFAGGDGRGHPIRPATHPHPRPHRDLQGDPGLQAGEESDLLRSRAGNGDAPAGRTAVYHTSTRRRSRTHMIMHGSWRPCP